MRSRPISRAIELLTLLQSRRSVTVSYLAQTLRCSRRTVFRDMQVLREAGFAIWYDELQGNYVVGGKPATRPELSPAEWQALLLAAGLSPIAQVDIYGHDVARALAKLLALAPPAVQETTNNLLHALRSAFAQQRTSAPVPPQLALVLSAVGQRRCLRFPLAGQVVQHRNAPHQSYTKFSPFRVYMGSEGWMVQGRSTWHQGIINIPIAHLHDVEVLDETYQLPRSYLHMHRPPGSSRLNGAARRVTPAIPTTMRAPVRPTEALKAQVPMSPQR